VLKYAHAGDNQLDKEIKQPIVKDVQLYLTYLTTTASIQTTDLDDSTDDDMIDTTSLYPSICTHTTSFTPTSIPQTTTPMTPDDKPYSTRSNRITSTHKTIASNSDDRQDKLNNNKRKCTKLTTETLRGASSQTIRATNEDEDVKPPNRPTKKKKQMNTSNSESKHEILQSINEDDDVDLSTPAFPTIPTNMEGMTECIICTDPFYPSDALVSICGDRRHIVHFACW
jgi:hypothetical protein